MAIRRNKEIETGIIRSLANRSSLCRGPNESYESFKKRVFDSNGIESISFDDSSEYTGSAEIDTKVSKDKAYTVSYDWLKCSGFEQSLLEIPKKDRQRLLYGEWNCNKPIKETDELHNDDCLLKNAEIPEKQHLKAHIHDDLNDKANLKIYSGKLEEPSKRKLLAQGQLTMKNSDSYCPENCPVSIAGNTIKSFSTNSYEPVTLKPVFTKEYYQKEIQRLQGKIDELDKREHQGHVSSALMIIRPHGKLHEW